MNRRYITDKAGSFCVEIEVEGPILGEAIDHANADDVLKCVVMAALGALAQDGPWPGALLRSMSTFMSDMKALLEREQLN